MEELVATGALQPVLASDFTLVGGSVRAQEVELEIQDRDRHSYRITLALAGSNRGTPDGQGARFLYYLAASERPPNPRATTALLALAALFDGAIPETALARCAGGDAPRGDRRYPRRLALASAVLEWSIVMASILYALRAIRPAGRDDPAGVDSRVAGRDA